MTSKNRKLRKKPPKKSGTRKKTPSRDKPRARPLKKKILPKMSAKALPTVIITPRDFAKEGVGIKIAVERIDETTRVGDLIVVYPRTREVLKKHGLRLEVEEAGDIFITLGTFAAMKGVKTEELIQEVVECSKEPPPQPPPPAPQLVAPTAA